MGLRCICLWGVSGSYKSIRGEVGDAAGGPRSEGSRVSDKEIKHLGRSWG